MDIYIDISNKTLRGVVVRFLEKLNHRVMVLGDVGRDFCLGHSDVRDYGCLLLEQTCSHPAGELKRLRAQDGLHNTPVIVIVANGNALPYPEAKALGIYGYLHSPLELSELELMLTHLAH